MGVIQNFTSMFVHTSESSMLGWLMFSWMTDLLFPGFFVITSFANKSTRLFRCLDTWTNSKESNLSFLSLAMFWYFNSWRSMVCQSLLIYSVTMMESFMGFRFFAPTSNVSLILANRVPYFACLLSALKSNFKDSSNMSPTNKNLHIFRTVDYITCMLSLHNFQQCSFHKYGNWLDKSILIC